MPRAYAIDLTACWRPRVGMVTLSIALTRALLEQPGDRRWILLGGRDPVDGLDAPFVLSPYRHELLNKLVWMPVVERAVGADAILYPYWPSPPRRQRGAPPAVVFVHDLAFRVFPGGVPWQQRMYLGLLLPRAAATAAAIIVPSEATRADLVAAFHVPPERVRVVPEGGGHLGAEAGKLPAGVEPGRYLLSVATVEPRKNVARLLTAYRRLRERRPAAPDLVLVGAIPYWADRRAVELLATRGVRHLGHVDDPTLVALYRGAIALAYPSLYEGFGLPLLEAMREGVPALISARGALPELAGGAALEVDAEDVEAIAQGLERLIDGGDLRARLAAAGRERAAGYTWDRAARRVLEILDSVAL